VDEAVRGAVRGAVDGAVDGAVHGAVRGAVDGAWYRYFGGQHWTGWWQPCVGFFRDHCSARMDVSAEMWDRSQAYDAAQMAGWWWPHSRFVVVAERAEFVRRERVAPTGWGSHRLHCEDGPAIRWRDGWAIWAWHGVVVPGWVIADPTPGRIFAESNQEIRRAGIESLGWDAFASAARLRLVDSRPDPANPGRDLELYDIPVGLLDVAERLLLVTNSSPDRSGEIRRYGLTVPAGIDDALSAAAWTFDLGPGEYATLERTT